MTKYKALIGLEMHCEITETNTKVFSSAKNGSKTSDEDLPIKFSMNLDDNGSLRIDVSCAQSGQKLTISALDSNFVKYE